MINGSTLVDTGAGHNKDYLFSKLRENGVEPDDIELIINTHCHFDHIFIFNFLGYFILISSSNPNIFSSLFPIPNNSPVSFINKVEKDYALEKGLEIDEISGIDKQMKF